MEAESSAVRYDRGKAEAAFDGLDVIAGQEGMLWAGALRMVAGGSDNWVAAERYSYNPTGNITSRNLVSETQWITRTYYYSDSAHIHAVTQVSNGWEFEYDGNGNMTGREDTGMYIQAFDVENPASLRSRDYSRLVAVTDTQTLSVTRFIYDGNGARVMTTYPDGSWTAYPGEHYEVAGTGPGQASKLIDDFEYADSPLNHGWVIYAGSGTLATVGDAGRPGRVMRTTTSQGINFGIRYPASGYLGSQRTQLSVWIKDTNAFCFYVRVRATDGNDYYIRYDPNNGSPYPYGSYAMVPVGTAYRDGNWHELNRDLDADLRAVFGVGVAQVLWFCIRGDYYLDDLRLIGKDETVRSYYYLGSQWVAMRVSDGVNHEVYWFHTDHPSTSLRTGPSAALRTGLGSTSLLSDEAGSAVPGSEMRFLPYGEYRVESTADLTDHGFTGQKHNDDLSLVYMKARYYVPALGRFLSPDIIVPDPSNPQSFNRYNYVNNRPLRYRDLSGHIPCIDGIGSACTTVDRGEWAKERAAQTTRLKYARLAAQWVQLYRQDYEVSQLSEPLNPADMSLSDQGLQLVLDMEGSSRELYNDVGGNCTIGVGHLVHLGSCQDVEVIVIGGVAYSVPYGVADSITDDQASRLFRADLGIAAQAVQTNISRPISQEQFDALAIAAYNIGPHVLDPGESLTVAVNQGDDQQVAAVLRSYCNAWNPRYTTRLPNQGLVRRREYEITLYRYGVYRPW